MDIHFEQHLQARGYRFSTIHGFMRMIARFITWCRDQDREARTADYALVMDYLQYSRNTCKAHTIGQMVNSLRHYFAFLVTTGVRQDNPVTELRLRTATRTVPHDILEWDELQAIYRDYPAVGVTGKRNKAMLGLLIYQALHTAELSLLEVSDLKLSEGTIYVPGAGRSEGRTLPLEAHQVLQLQTYLVAQRPALLELSGKDSTRLFLSSGTGHRMSDSYTRLLRVVQQVNSRVKDLRQLRASVITHWLKTTNIRQVQYQAGHRYVSSTDHYRTNHLEGLQEQLENLLPLQ